MLCFTNSPEGAPRCRRCHFWELAREVKNDVLPSWKVIFQPELSSRAGKTAFSILIRFFVALFLQGVFYVFVRFGCFSGGLEGRHVSATAMKHVLGARTKEHVPCIQNIQNIPNYKYSHTIQHKTLIILELAFSFSFFENMDFFIRFFVFWEVYFCFCVCLYYKLLFLMRLSDSVWFSVYMNIF